MDEPCHPLIFPLGVQNGQMSAVCLALVLTLGVIVGRAFEEGDAQTVLPTQVITLISRTVIC